MRGRTCITIWNCMRKCKKGMVLGALNPLFWRPKCVFGAIEMPRANRYFLPGYVWHITHRCHKREFLMKFSLDQHRWLQWLYEAKKRFGISILNYGVTSNHPQQKNNKNNKTRRPSTIRIGWKVLAIRPRLSKWGDRKEPRSWVYRDYRRIGSGDI
jgi:hypothetical protein